MVFLKDLIEGLVAVAGGFSSVLGRGEGAGEHRVQRGHFFAPPLPLPPAAGGKNLGPSGTGQPARKKTGS
jgi:hypothetical protein